MNAAKAPLKTLNVSEDLHREIRILAAERGESIQQIVEDALWGYLKEVKDGADQAKRTPPE